MVSAIEFGVPSPNRGEKLEFASFLPAIAAATFTLDAARRRWRGVVRLSRRFVAERRTFQDWIAATAGVALTATLVLYLIVSARRRREN